MTEFKGFPMRDDVADYPSHSEMFKYFNDYADHFKLKEHYTFNTLVSNIERNEDDTWSVTLSNGETKIYNHVVIANGTLTEPDVPSFKGTFQEN
jgi:cation diffusion facilitator CzcD-associated flavoprotein CzcO